MPTRINVLFPLPLRDQGIGHTCLSIARTMRCSDLEFCLITPKAFLPKVPAFVRPSAPFPLRALPYRWFRRYYASSCKRVFLNALPQADAVYLWSELPIELSRALKNSRMLVLREKFNCHKAAANRILEGAYHKLRWPRPMVISAGLIAKEREELGLADYIFAPSPSVRDSLVEEGVPEAKILSSSYGWDPVRIRAGMQRLPRRDTPVFLFVGTACVRKGIPFLLQAWSRAKLSGTLVIAGAVDGEVGERCADLLNLPNIRLLGHLREVSTVYEQADVFVIPSLEEGSPLVIYEAMASGLPSLASRMGGGGVMRDGVDGLEVNPLHVDELAERMRTLAHDVDLRVALGAAARQRAMEFTWELVGARRRALLRTTMSRG